MKVTQGMSMTKLENHSVEIDSGLATRIWRRFRRQRIAILGMAIVLLMLLIALSAPIICRYDPHDIHLQDAYLFPSAAHWFGTDSLGRDVFSRVIWGTRTSLTVAVIGILVTSIIGIAMGSISGYYRKLDDLIMRFTDIVLTFPSFFLLIVAASVLQVRNLYVIAVVIGFIGWPQMARIVRGEFLSIRELSYVEAARAIGASNSRLIVLHMLPNCMAPIIVTVTLNVARYILYEAAISFLGLGDPTAISWGTIIGRGQQVLRSAWWLTLFPGVMIFLIVLGFNLFGDGFRDVMDPQLAYLHRQEGGN